MWKHKLQGVKKWLVSVTGNWFYPSNKLPVGTHLHFFFTQRVQFDLAVIFDVGANVGHFSKELNSYYSKSTFFCFEPFPQTFERLKFNLKEPNFHLYQLALGDHSEKVLVEKPDSDHPDTNSLVTNPSANNSGKSISIQVTTVDEFMEKESIKTIDVLKIDTEGFDLKVLMGSRKALEKGLVKLIYVECGLDPSNKYHVYFPEILSYLTGLGYVFIGFFQTDIRKIDRKIHFSNALFVHQAFAHKIKTYL